MKKVVYLFFFTIGSLSLQSCLASLYADKLVYNGSLAKSSKLSPVVVTKDSVVISNRISNEN